MGRRGGRRRGGHEYCGGYFDDNAIWNNGFYCPRWGGLDQQYCCGDVSYRYCCPQTEQTTHQPDTPPNVSFIPIIIGVSVGLFVILAIVLTVCFVCCCHLGSRKRPKPPMPDQEASSQPATEAVTCATCQQQGAMGVASGGVDHSMLHCGCRYSPTAPRTSCSPTPDVSDIDTLMMTLYENPSAAWQAELERMADYPIEDPPPYTESDTQKSQKVKIENRSLPRSKTHSIKSLTLERPFKPNQLCMTTFRPLSPHMASPRILRIERDRPDKDRDGKRDSGVLMDDQLESAYMLEGLHEQPVVVRPGGHRGSRASLDPDLTDMKVSAHGC